MGPPHGSTAVVRQRTSPCTCSIRPGIVLRPLHPDDAPVRGIYAATWRTITAPPPVTAFLDCLDDVVRELRNDYSVTLLR
jgi:hypothetical protein